MAASDSDVPSEKLDVLRRLKGKEILKAVRFGWWSAEEFIKLFKIKDCELFSFTEGTLLIYLGSGEVAGFTSADSLNSLIVWMEREGEEKGEAELEIERNEEFFPVFHDDERFSQGVWREISGKKIERVFLIKRKPIHVLYEDLPNEVGLMFVMDSREQVFLCHGLCSKPNDFSVCGYEDLRVDVIGELSFLEIF
ncbi:hypothetical protein QYE80_10200 [Pseudomonas tohonis]|nr:hypothetical protein [Pseudomonas tohonis]